VVSEEMAPEELPQTASTVTLNAEFRQADGRLSPLGSLELPIKPALKGAIECLTDAASASGSVSGTTGVLPRIEVDGSDTNGDTNQLILDECVVPEGADISAQAAPGGPAAAIDELEADGENRRFLIIIEGPFDSDADNDLGAVIVDPGDQYLGMWKQLQPPQTLSQQLLTCGLGRNLPEIQAGLPLRVVVEECRVDPPASGMVTVDAFAQGAGFGYFIEAPEDRGEQPWTLVSDSAPLTLRVVSQELGTNGWDYYGLVTMNITAFPSDGLPQSLRSTVDVPSGLLDDLLSCGPMHLVNADEDEVPSDPLHVTLDCEFALRGSEGDLRFTVDAAPSAGTGDEGPEALSDWRFLPASELLDNGRGLRFGEGEAVKELNLETANPLPNDRIQHDGTVMVTAQWTMPGWQSPLTANTTTQYTVDLWPRSVVWLAVLITLIAALATWFALYSVVVTMNRLPRANEFFARRLDFNTYQDGLGQLRSKEIDSFKPDDVPEVFVAGDGKRQKWLRTEGLRIEARHPKWWQIATMLRGGCRGEAKVSGFGGDIGAMPKPANPKSAEPAGGTAITSEQFSELFVVALEGSNAGNEPRGVAYMLMPKNPQKRSQGTERKLAEILAGLDSSGASGHSGSSRQGDTLEATSSSASEPQPRDDTYRPPPRNDSGPPPRNDSGPPPRER